MVADPDPDADGITRATLAKALGVPVSTIGSVPIAGRVHRHWRVGADQMLRVPRMSHLGLTPRRNLIYAVEAFRRMVPSGAVPGLHKVLRVGEGLPWGALLIDAIDGRPPRLPEDLPAVARALASIHRLPLPERRAPLLDPAGPLAYLLSVVQAQLDPVRDLLGEAAGRILAEELSWATNLLADGSPRPVPSLVAADTHPGNFRIRDDGRAVLIDVERPVYDSAAVDLAHASLPTSLHWDPAVDGQAGRHDIVDFHNAWATAVPVTLADAVRPWVLVYRRLVWLRTTSWACAWAARNDVAAAPASPHAETSGADPSGVAGRLARFIDPEMMEQARAQWLGPWAFTVEELIP